MLKNSCLVFKLFDATIKDLSVADVMIIHLQAGGVCVVRATKSS